MKLTFEYFLILFFIPLLCSQFCGLNPPREESDCFINEPDKYDCCYLYNDSYSYCLQIQNSTQIDTSQNYTYQGNQYQIKCNIQKFYGQIGTRCGLGNPQKLADCNDWSSHDNFCCLYNTTSLSKCFWLGTTFSGEIFSFNSSNNYTVTCLANHLQNYFFTFWIVYLIMLMF